jgi:hypothetical protein
MSRNSPEGIAERLIDLSIEVAPALGLIADLKESLRKIVEDTGDAFIIEVPGKGSVEVKAGHKAELRGILPTLNAEVFVGLPKQQQNKLTESGLVELAENWSKDTRPSVTVRL